MCAYFIEDTNNLTSTRKYKEVLYTDEYNQFMMMSLKADEDIGMEKHESDQYIKIIRGNGYCILNGDKYELNKNTILIIPAGVEHNIINGSDSVMKLYTIYSPPIHPPDFIQNKK